MQRTFSALVIVALCACGKESQITQPLQAPPLAERVPDARARARQYDVVTLPSLGGTSRGNAISDHGLVAGYSTLPGGQARHAALWHDGSLADLGTLGGPNSSVPWPGLNDRGVAAGIAEMAAIDPLGEDWSCSAFFPSVTHHVCRGFVWESGRMTALPTLGGTNGFATGVNSRGLVVGWAETPVHDPTCNAPQMLQFRAVVWDPKHGTTTELRPLPGDSTSAATAINARGQVVGISGACDVAVGEFSARHMVLWDHGRATDLGSLGGVAWNTPMAINARGDVVGFSDLPGDANGVSNSHAFLWTTREGIRDLGMLPGDDNSQALGINARRQIVGISCAGSACRAFLWEDGVMTDLTARVRSANGDQLSSAQDINDAGQITGRVLQKSTGKRLAFVATPVSDHR